MTARPWTPTFGDKVIIHNSNRESLNGQEAIFVEGYSIWPGRICDIREVKVLLKAGNFYVCSFGEIKPAPDPAISALVEAADRLLDAVGCECRHDHHGHCQEHFVSNPCEAQMLQAALATVKGRSEGV